jgi:uncharacterized protein (TIGR02118 family)
VARLVVVYKTPKDPSAFDRHYFDTHVPLAKKIPGLRKYEVSTGPLASPAGPSGVHLIAILQFDDAAAISALSRARKDRARPPTCRPSRRAAPICSSSIAAKCERELIGQTAAEARTDRSRLVSAEAE